MKQNDDFELKRALDALPRAIEPPADLWPEVRAKIGPRAARRAPRAASRWFAEHFEMRTIRIAAGIGAIGVGLAILGAQTRAGAQWSVCSGCTMDKGLQGAFRSMEAGQAVSTHSYREISVPSNNPVVERRVPGSAVLRVGTIGEVQLAPDTWVQLLDARATSHRMALRRGMIHARITAPPRLFVVETPAGTAVDMGCEYTLHVDDAGTSVLHVKLGWVSFEDRGREALVPQGYMMISRPGVTGIPVAETAPDRVRWAAANLGQGLVMDSALAVLRASARPADAVTVWHLLGRVDTRYRPDMYDLLSRLTPPPAGVTRDGALAGDRIMLRLWWEQLPGTLPITPSLVRQLWMVWLKVGSWL